MAHIIIIGAGVIGLQTAVTLLEVGYKVTIIAKHFPGDKSIEYTSPWAGAIWRTHATRHEAEQCEWDLESYRSWMKTVEYEPERAKEMGIERRPMHLYSNELHIDTSSPALWFASHVQNFITLSADQLPPGCRAGCAHDSISLNPPKYLNFLHNRSLELGASTIRQELLTRDDLGRVVKEVTAERIDEGSKTIVVNCTGLGARTLWQDENMYPIRGQTVLVRINPPSSPSSVKIILHPATAPGGGVTYIVPRPGTDTFIFGGTKNVDDWNPEPDPEITKGIIERCKIAWPEIKDAEINILSVQVGLRPGRKGGARVEIERLDLGNALDVDVIHQYGHAGAGYQNSIGSANKVLVLVQRCQD